MSSMEADVLTSEVLRRERARVDRSTLEARLRRRREAGRAAVARIERQTGVPGRLSYSQQRLWLLSQMTGASPVYNISFAIRLQDHLDVGVLQRCLQSIVTRHETLRTRFVVQDGEARPLVEPAGALALVAEPVDGIEQVYAIWRSEREYPFDLGSERLFRARLLREAADSHVLVVTLHHIISDAWSLGVFFRELVSLYRDYSHGREGTLQELPIQFSDYALWQRQWLSPAALEQHLRYWREQLSGMPPLLMLPTDRPRPAVQSFRGGTEAIHIPSRLRDRLRELSAAHGATLFMTLLAGFATLLGRYAGQEDVAIGAPVANRSRRETEDLIGFFVNTLVMRTDLSGDPRFSELLGRVRQNALQAYAHQELPFEYLVEKLRPERSLSYNPLFQATLILQNAPLDTVTLEGVRVSPLNGEEMDGFSRFDLTLSLGEGSEGLKGVLEYNADLFDRERIRGMADHYLRLLESIVAAPESRIGSLDWLSDLEKQRQTVSSPESACAPRVWGCVHEAVLAQTQRTPDAIAVRQGARQLSYAQLNLRAHRLALRLRQEGVQVGDRVGLYMERSIELVVAMLAVLKAGAAYVPLDPNYPSSRIEYLIQDADITRILDEASCSAEALANGPIHSDGCLSDGLSAVLPGGLSAEHAAYVIYTSGSTGNPKGVIGSHRSLMNRLQWMNDQHPVQSQEVFCQKTSIGFVDHVAEIFQALLCGNSLIILPQSCLHSPSQFLQELQCWRVTRVTVVPALLHALVKEPDAGVCSSLRLLIASGEALVLESFAGFARRFPNAQLLNLYGSTEVGADVTCYGLRGQESGPIPIGRAIANTGTHVLSPQGQLLPCGAVGELYVSGSGLSHGYWQRAALTAERFVPDPFSRTPGARLFRTGDLARHRADGELEYLGRLDHQVKVRGFRIELGEIEAALQSHPRVACAAVTTHASHNGELRVVAYVVANGHSDAGEIKKALRAHLHSKLPHYMMPAVIEVMAALPLSSSGKVDRRALPAPEEIPAESFEEPLGEHECLLAEAWRELLQCRCVGREDNFFELGGHSLLLTQLASRIRTCFNLEPPLLELFERQTLRSQAEWLASLAAARSGGLDAAAEAPIEFDESLRATPQPLSFCQQRLWFLNRLVGPNAIYNISMALRLHGELDVTALERSFNQLIERHESLRTSFLEIDGEARQQIAGTQPWTLRVETVSGEEGIVRAASDERSHRFDLSNEPLLRTRVLRLDRAGDPEHILIVTVHHIVADGWSVGVLFSDLLALYRANKGDGRARLPVLTSQYLDFAARQRQPQRGERDGGDSDVHIAYWRERLRDLPPLLELPADRPRPPEQSFRGSGVSFELPPTLLNDLQALSRRRGVTLFMTLLSAYAALLYRYTGQSDIPIGVPIANRTRRELEKVIGYFANTLVMRSDLGGNPTFDELLGRTRAMALEAYAHQDAPFERVVEALNPTRSLSYSPLFQAMFVLQNAPMPVQEVAGLSVSSLVLPEEQGSSRFDLHLAMGEVEGRLAGRVEYNTDLFDRDRIERFVAHLGKFLAQIAAAPQLPIGRHDYLSDRERQQQLIELNATAREFPTEATLCGLFEAQVDRTPDAVAVELSSSALSYAELNARANRLAHYLLAAGVQPDECVGLCAERSLEMVVGIYGILKAGCAYVPLEPEYPPERLALMLRNTGAKHLVVQGGKGVETDVRVIDISSTAGLETLALYSDCNPPRPGFHSRHLAYVIHTSGSTGQPKGVMNEHRGAVNRIVWMQNEYGLSASDVVLQKTPFSFDVSVWEFVWPLIYGAKLVVAPPGAHRDPDHLVQLIGAAQVTVLHFVPSMLQGMLALGRWGTCNSVRYVFCSGEALSRETVKAFFATGTRSELHNLYGPTEAAIDVTYWPCAPTGTSVPIGKPIQNIRLYIVDENMELLPQGASGELLIGGVGVARGYIRRPDLTQDRFIPDPFDPDPQSRLYRTGDRVRRLPGGEIEYLGRIDTQVKISGLRIEPGEIESCLDALAGIQQSVVIAHQHPGEAARLVAYLVLKDPQQEIPVAQIKEALAERLPAFMIPQVYVALDAIPLSSNGKLDRRRLPEPPRLVRNAMELVAAATEIEQRLLDLWRSNLGISAAGVTDDYFSLGGDSIRAIALVAQARVAGIEFGVKDLFVHPTIRSLAGAIGTGRLQEIQTAVPDAFDLITAEEKHALLDQFA